MAGAVLGSAWAAVGPVDTLLRLLYLKHRYGLGYESLGREVSNSLGCRRFCRIGLDRPVPHPTTLVKLVRRAGPGVVEQLNAALVAKLAQGKLLRARVAGYLAGLANSRRPVSISSVPWPSMGGNSRRGVR